MISKRDVLTCPRLPDCYCLGERSRTEPEPIWSKNAKLGVNSLTEYFNLRRIIWTYTGNRGRNSAQLLYIEWRVYVEISVTVRLDKCFVRHINNSGYYFGGWPMEFLRNNQHCATSGRENRNADWRALTIWNPECKAIQTGGHKYPKTKQRNNWRRFERTINILFFKV